MASTAQSYEPTTAAERHMQDLIERLPRMEALADRLRAHREAALICAQYDAVDDLEQAIAILEDQDPLDTAEGPQLHAVLLAEKRASLGRERSRLDRDLERSRFATIIDAHRARLDADDLRRASSELQRFREDYALTLARCQEEAVRA